MIAHQFQRLDDHRLGRREALSSAGHRIGLIRAERRKPQDTRGKVRAGRGAGLLGAFPACTRADGTETMLTGCTTLTL